MYRYAPQFPSFFYFSILYLVTLTSVPLFSSSVTQVLSSEGDDGGMLTSLVLTLHSPLRYTWCALRGVGVCVRVIIAHRCLTWCSAVWLTNSPSVGLTSWQATTDTLLLLPSFHLPPWLSCITGYSRLILWHSALLHVAPNYTPPLADGWMHEAPHRHVSINDSGWMLVRTGNHT